MHTASANHVRHTLAWLAIVGRSEDGHVRPDGIRSDGRSCREPVGEPPLGVTVGRTWSDTDPDTREPVCAGAPQFVQTMKPYNRMHRQRVEHARPPQQLEVGVALVAGNLHRSRHGDRFGEQQATPIHGIADPNRNSRKPCDEGGVKSILQQDRHVETTGPQGSGKPPAAQEIPPPRAGSVGDDLIDERMPVEAGDPRSSEDGEMRLRERASNVLDGRHRHHDIAHPVGGANENAVVRCRHNEATMTARPVVN